MNRIDFYTLEESEKAAIFNSVAAEFGMTPFAVEKDWWVSRTLEIIFTLDIGAHLVFKGGTSLSKAWKLIRRFSEDIDLAIDRQFFQGYQGNLSRTQIVKLRKEAGQYTTGTFFTDLKESFIARGFHGLEFTTGDSGESDQDPRIIQLVYPNIIPQPSVYVLPRVQIEISCRSLREPYTPKLLGSLVDEYYADREFAAPPFIVPTVNAERTFLEKLFLLHEEFHRPFEKIRVNRLSRHLYDIYELTKAGIADKAIRDKELYETIVAHRFKFSRVGDVDYNLHHPQTLNPIPIIEKMTEWKTDYARMMEEMIYEEKKPSFDDLISNLGELRTTLQNTDWLFELNFPVSK